MSLLQNARLCHKCNEQFAGKLCPKCSTKAELLAGRILAWPEPEKIRVNIAALRVDSIPHSPETAPPAPPAPPKPARGMSAPKLNVTEQRWQDAHPSHKPFPIRLRWGNCMNYTPDFMYRDAPVLAKPVLIEIKGFAWSRDIVRFKGCAAQWDWLFDFQLWEWKGGKWTRIY